MLERSLDKIVSGIFFCRIGVVLTKGDEIQKDLKNTVVLGLIHSTQFSLSGCDSHSMMDPMNQ